MTNLLTFDDLLNNLANNSDAHYQITQVSQYLRALRLEPTYHDQNNIEQKRSFNKKRYHDLQEKLSFNSKLTMMQALAMKDYTIFGEDAVKHSLLNYFVNIKNKAVEHMTNDEFKLCFESLKEIKDNFFQTMYAYFLKEQNYEMNKVLLKKVLETKSFGEKEKFNINIDNLIETTVRNAATVNKLDNAFKLLKEVGIDYENYPRFFFKIQPLKKDFLKHILKKDYNYLLKNEAQIAVTFLNYFDQGNVEQCYVFIDLASSNTLKLIIDKMNERTMPSKKIPQPNGYILLNEYSPLKVKKEELLSYLENQFLEKSMSQEVTHPKKMKL